MKERTIEDMAIEYGEKGCSYSEAKEIIEQSIGRDLTTDEQYAVWNATEG